MDGHEISRRPTLGIVGGGIAGLGLARELQHDFDIALFEKEPQLGGHIRPVPVTDADGDTQDVDTGFWIYQPAHYPDVTRLLDELGVETEEMRFAAEFTIWEKEADRLVRPADILAGQAPLSAETAAVIRQLSQIEPDSPEAVTKTLDQYFRDNGLSTEVLDRLIVPILGVIWSAREAQVRAMSASGVITQIRRLASPTRRLARNTRLYLDAVLGSLRQVALHPNTGVAAVVEEENGVSLIIGGEKRHFDYVVLATHADCTMRLLGDAAGDRGRALQSLTYNRSVSVVHTDLSVLPEGITHSVFTMTTLQRSPETRWLSTRDNTPGPDRQRRNRLLVSAIQPDLLETGVIDEAHIRRVVPNAHPSMTPSFIQAQDHLTRLNIGPRLFLAGSYFHPLCNHEGAYASGLEVGRKLREAAQLAAAARS